MSNKDKLNIINILIIYEKITTKLQIKYQALLDSLVIKYPALLDSLVNTPKENNNSNEVIQLFREILEYDEAINNYGKNITNSETKEKFNNLKKSLGKLQIIVLINKLNKSNNCKKILNTFVNTINAIIEEILLLDSN